MSLKAPVIALAGNPNVGKSSIFNQLTGLKQHTGNWSGKTVGTASGTYTTDKKEYVIVDLPGTYSLLAHSPEEEIARDFLCNQKPAAVISVCDATNLERGLNLTLQILEITPNVVLCINLIDEAEKRGIKINFKGLSEKLKIPVIAVSARRKRGITRLMECTALVCLKKSKPTPPVKYIKPLETAIELISAELSYIPDDLTKRRTALELLEGRKNSETNISLGDALKSAYTELEKNGIERDRISDVIASCIILAAEDIANTTIRFNRNVLEERDRKIDKILTSPLTGIPIMLLLFAFIFYLTAVGANVPSALLSTMFGWLEGKLIELSIELGIPELIYSPLICGVYHVLTWVISVMLPPMAIFFPLFTFLEELGYLPRIAFNLDKYFKKCSACGKQALTM